MKVFIVQFLVSSLLISNLSSHRVSAADPRPDDENQVGGRYSVVGGGRKNSVTGNASTIGGGANNTVTGKGAVVAGGEDHQAAGLHSSVLGGRDNHATEPGAVVGGGAENRALGRDSTVSGGYKNQARANATVVGGGLENLVTSDFGVLGGGQRNVVSGSHGTVAGGVQNVAAGIDAFVGGGRGNIAGGSRGAVLAGFLNEANGEHSVAMGTSAKADHRGAFVFSDATKGEFESVTENEFAVRAQQLRIQRGSLRVNSEVRSSVGFEDETSGESRRLITLTTPGFAGGGIWSLDVDPQGALIVARDGAIARAALSATGGGWLHTSDRKLKRDLQPVDGLLEKVSALQVHRFHAADSSRPTERQIGFVAQELEPVFPELVGRVGGHLAIEYDRLGAVAVGAVKELNQKSQRQIADLQRENAELKRQLAVVLGRLDRLESAAEKR